MASYGIFRVEKLKKVANLVGSLKHAFREQDTPNADPSKRGENELLTPDTQDVETTLSKYERLKPQGKIRSDVVHAIEVLVTASPEKIQSMSAGERTAFFNDALKFCNAEFGEGNLLHAQIHNDETTGHLTAFYIPVIEKTNKKGEVSRKLNASALLGGKKDYSERQTRFHKNVGEKYGLERGEIGSKATHKKVLDWYKEVNLERAGDDFKEVMEKKAIKQVTVEVDEAKTALFGFQHTVETVSKQVPLKYPVVPLPSITEALKPRINGNSEMKRREKEAWKKEVRKEVEEEERKKFDKTIKEEMEKVNSLKMETQKIKERYDNFYLKIYDKLIDVRLEIKEKTYKAIEDALFTFMDKFTSAFSVLEKRYIDASEKLERFENLLEKANRELENVKSGKNWALKQMSELESENKALTQKVETLRKPRSFEQIEQEYLEAREAKEQAETLAKMQYQARRMR